MTAQELIAARMRELREDAGLTQSEVAKRLGMDIRSYRRWESCDSLGFMYRLRDVGEALGSSEAELVEGVADLEEAVGHREAINLKLDVILDELRSIREQMTMLGATSSE